MLPAMAGVVGGSLLLLAIIWAGAGTTFEAVPQMRPTLRIAGAAYLIWLGILLVKNSTRHEASSDRTSRATLPNTLVGVALFQLLNPKSWVLVLTATAAMSDVPSGPFLLAALMAAITTSCLTLWAWAGAAIAKWLTNAKAKRRFDAAMGILLILSAGMLFI